MEINKVGISLLSLHDLAVSGSKLWESNENGFYQITFPNSSVQVGYDHDEDHGEPYAYVRFFNKNGLQILEVNGGNIHKYLEKNYTFIEEIYEGAKDAALNTDETFVDIINSISKLKKDN